MNFFQVALACALVALVCGQTYVAPVPVASVAGTDAEFDPNPKYEFQYSVADPVTGDQKSQQETRDGDRVTGFYTVVESDGSLRRVEYYADAASGFVATVTHQPGGQAPPAPATYQTYKPQEVVAPIKYVAPAPVKVTPAPVTVVQQPVKAQPIYYQPQPAYYQQPSVYYQPQQAYYQQPAVYYQPQQSTVAVAPAQAATVTGYFSSPYANYALPGSGNPTGAITSSATKSNK